MHRYLSVGAAIIGHLFCTFSDVLGFNFLVENKHNVQSFDHLFTSLEQASERKHSISDRTIGTERERTCPKCSEKRTHSRLVAAEVMKSKGLSQSVSLRFVRCVFECPEERQKNASLRLVDFSDNWKVYTRSCGFSQAVLIV